MQMLLYGGLVPVGYGWLAGSVNVQMLSSEVAAQEKTPTMIFSPDGDRFLPAGTFGRAWWRYPDPQAPPPQVPTELRGVASSQTLRVLHRGEAAECESVFRSVWRLWMLTELD